MNYSFLRFSLFLTLVFGAVVSFAQNDYTQTVRGTILDRDTRATLPSAQVILFHDSTQTGMVCDVNGVFRFENIPFGRHTLKINYIGYETLLIRDIMVSSGKEVVLNIEMQESMEMMEEVVVEATKKGEVKNDMALVSVRTFAVEETDRYAGSRGDPARMASNFAGVQGGDDSRNDIIIRGNSPLGVLWKVDGISIPSPNHFSVAGSTGGPLSILNNKVLANSDFFTGAFPAEYGNSTAGVFDLKFRSGNNEKHEFSGQFGFLGTEMTAEGPIKKSAGSSYLVAYRYSTLSLFKSLGIQLGTDAVPTYQDINFKFNFPLKKGGSISFFGLAGKSDIDIMISDQLDPEKLDLYGENDRDQHFGTAMGVGGLVLTKPINKNTFIQVSVSSSFDHQKSKHQYVVRHVDPVTELYVNDSLYDILGYQFDTYRHSANLYVNRKIGKRHLIRGGFSVEYYQFNMADSTSLTDSTGTFSNVWLNRWDYVGGGMLIQPFIQWKYRLAENLTLNTGWHGQLFTFNNTSSWVEPRVALRWGIGKSSALNFGFGVHSQTQPMYQYTYHITNADDEYERINHGMGMSKSNHYVIGYDQSFTSNLRLKAEVYYQQLYNMPVELTSSAFSLVNMGSGFNRFFPKSALVNEGKGENYGIELTVEKFFSKRFYFMITGSVYESTYSGSDNINRPTDFNGNYAVNFLIGKEWSVGENSFFSLGGKITMAGGKRYGLVDSAASALINEIVWDNETYNSLQFKDYFRADLKINYKVNKLKVSHEIGLDLVNFLGIENILGLTYAPDPNNPGDFVRENYQLGFLPLFYYKIDF